MPVFETEFDIVKPQTMWRAPAVNTLNVSAVAIEAKAGETALEQRSILKIAKLGNGIVYWGGTPEVTAETGFPLFAEHDVEEFRFVPGTDVPIYLVAGQETEVRVAEW